MKRLTFALAFLALAAGSSVARAETCKHPVVPSNWKPCEIGPVSETGGEADWAAVPAWTKSPAIRPYFYGEPRLLALHGKCNAKFRRVVLCLPAWDLDEDKSACWYLICSLPSE
jgi:hypothetical protein